jgi:hypothetical protein
MEEILVIPFSVRPEDWLPFLELGHPPLYTIKIGNFLFIFELVHLRIATNEQVN